MWSETPLSAKRPNLHCKASVIVCYTADPPVAPPAGPYPKASDISRDETAPPPPPPSPSPCALNIAHLFVYVVGNCSKSKPGLLLLLLLLGLQRGHLLSVAASQLPPPVKLPFRLTHFHCSRDVAWRGPGVSNPPSLVEKFLPLKPLCNGRRRILIVQRLIDFTLCQLQFACC